MNGARTNWARASVDNVSAASSRPRQSQSVPTHCETPGWFRASDSVAPSTISPGDAPMARTAAAIQLQLRPALNGEKTTGAGRDPSPCEDGAGPRLLPTYCRAGRGDRSDCQAGTGVTE